MTAAVLVLAAALPALCSSLHINGPAGDDPRSVVPAAVLRSNPQAAFDHYTRFAGSAGHAPAQPRPTAETADIFVTSNFAYDRFAQFGASSEQPDSTHAKAAYYAALFKLPYLEVTNGRPSYAFFNPVIRIVALDGDRDRLAPIATALRHDAPGLTIQFVNAAP
jgi:pimeloyl-ACP methyl ester carboxylesterase